VRLITGETPCACHANPNPNPNPKRRNRGPQEPTKHQYDWDVSTTAGFLERNGLSEKYKINVECNHATLAGHRCARTLRRPPPILHWFRF
jgi:hypothetical protein